MINKTLTTLQMQAADCGAASLKMLLDYYDFHFTLDEVREIIGVGRDGSSVGDIVKAAEKLGFILNAKKYKLDDASGLVTPSIMWWNKNHFLIYEGVENEIYFLNDPAMGRRKVCKDEFLQAFSEIFIHVESKPSDIKSYVSESIVEPLSIYHSFIDHIKPQLTLAFLISLAGAIPAMFTAQLTSYFIDNVVVKNQTQLAPSFLWMFFFLSGLTTLLTLTTYKIINRATFITSTLKTYSFAKRIVSMPFKWLESRNADELSNRLVLPSQVSLGICYTSISQLSTVGRSIIISFLILFVAPLIGLIAFLLLGILAYVTYYVNRATESQNKRMSIQNGIAQGISISSLVSLEDVRLAGLENQRFSQWSGYYTNFLNSQQIVSLYQNTTGLFSNSAFYLLNTALISIGPLLIMQNKLTIGNYVAIQYLLGLVTSGIMLIPDILESYQTVSSSSERFRDVFETQDNSSTRSTKSLDFKHINLKLDNLLFSYDNTHPVFSGITGDIEILPITQIVSKSGGGKTTFLKLLAGLYLPGGGSLNLILDDSIKLNPTLTRLTYISDNPTFLTGTLLDNISFMDPRVTDKEALSSLHKACLHNFEYLSNPNHLIYAGGKQLSSIEKSRILLARIYASVDSIIIIDNLDFDIDESEYSNLFQWIYTTNRILIFSSTRSFDSQKQIFQLSIDNKNS